MNTEQLIAPAKSTEQFLTFTLDGQEFAIDVLQVQEIRSVTSMTPVPKASKAFKGVIEVRGAMVPIIDLRIALDMPLMQEFKFAVIVLLKINSTVVGVVVDSVTEVIELQLEEFELPQTLDSKQVPQVIQGIAQADLRTLTLLDLSSFVQQNIPCEFIRQMSDL